MTGHVGVPERRLIQILLQSEDLDRWLGLWEASQGGSVRNQRFELIATALPFDSSEQIDVLDMFSGPGDLGRFIQRRFSRARVDCVDRDRFLLALCAELNRRREVSTRVFERDAWDPHWRRGLDRHYHVIGATTALHWFDVARLGELIRDFHNLLRSGGVFCLVEPAAAESEFAAGLRLCAEELEPASEIQGRAWEEFWRRAIEILGYDHRTVLKTVPKGRNVIGDDGISVLGYVELLRAAGFKRIDILLRENRCVTIAAIKS